MTIVQVFTQILAIVGGSFIIGWEMLYDIPVVWFFDMSLGEIIMAVIGASMFVKIVLDLITGGGVIARNSYVSNRKNQKYQASKKQQLNMQKDRAHYYALKENKKRG